MPFEVRRVSDDEKTAAKQRRWTAFLVMLLSVARPMSAWYQDFRKRKDEEAHRHKRVEMLKRVMVILVSIFFAFLLLAGVAKALVQLRVISLRTIFAVT